MQVFAGREIHSKLMMKGLELQLKSMLGLAPSDAMDLRNYSAEDLAHAVRYYVKSEFFDPLADIWSDFQLASRYPKCAETIICDRNAPQSIRTSLGLKKAITRSARYYFFKLLSIYCHYLLSFLNIAYNFFIFFKYFL